MSFSEFMKQNDKIYKKLYVFDFDDTLVFAPHPNEGKKAYYEATGREWPHGNRWWSTSASLDPPIMPSPAPIKMLNSEVVREVYAGIRDPNTYVVVMTGRATTATDNVKRILKDYHIKADEVILTPWQETTLPFKIRQIKNLISRFENLEEVQVWDDKGTQRAKMVDNPSENHVASFKNLGKMIKNNKDLNDPEGKFKFKVNEVISPKVATFIEQQNRLKQWKETRNKSML